MKVTSTGAGLPPTEGGTAEPGDTAGPKGAAGPGFAEKLGGPLAASPTAPAQAPRQDGLAAAERPTPVRDIAAELRAGRIDSRTALDRVVDRIVDRQVGVSAPAPVRERIAAALRDALANDPMLVAKVRDLGA